MVISKSEKEPREAMIVEWESDLKDREYSQFSFTVLAHTMKSKEWTQGYTQKLTFIYNAEKDQYECIIPREMMDEFHNIYFVDGQNE